MENVWSFIFLILLNFERLVNINYLSQNNLSYTKQQRLRSLMMYVNDITVESLKFRPIITKTEIYMYKTAIVISKYLKTMYETNDSIIKTHRTFQLKLEHPPFEEAEKGVAHNVEELLLKNFLLHDTIKWHYLEEIYIYNKLPHICSKLIFKKFLLKLVTERTFFLSQFYKLIGMRNVWSSVGNFIQHFTG